MTASYWQRRNAEMKHIQDEAETAAKLEGVVSKETQLNTLSIVDDARKEIERIEEENAPLPQYDFEVGATE